MWWLWLIVALVALVVEIAGSGLIFAGICAASLIAASAAVLGAPLVVDAAIFGLASVAYLVGLRPPVIRLLYGNRYLLGAHDRANPIVGKRGIVTVPVSEDGGQIRIGQGEFWSARLYEAGPPLPAGSRIQVMWLEGLTALVEPVTSPGVLAQE